MMTDSPSLRTLHDYKVFLRFSHYNFLSSISYTEFSTSLAKQTVPSECPLVQRPHWRIDINTGGFDPQLSFETSIYPNYRPFDLAHLTWKQLLWKAKYTFSHIYPSFVAYPSDHIYVRDLLDPIVHLQLSSLKFARNVEDFNISSANCYSTIMKELIISDEG